LVSDCKGTPVSGAEFICKTIPPVDDPTDVRIIGKGSSGPDGAVLIELYTNPEPFELFYRDNLWVSLNLLNPQYAPAALAKVPAGATLDLGTLYRPQTRTGTTMLKPSRPVNPSTNVFIGPVDDELMQYRVLNPQGPRFNFAFDHVAWSWPYNAPQYLAWGFSYDAYNDALQRLNNGDTTGPGIVRLQSPLRCTPDTVLLMW
jgi:hypothetical protein